MGVLDLLFPKTCLGCKKEGEYICRPCLNKVQVLKPVCPYCEKASIDGFTHIKCKKKYGLDGLTSIWKYDGVVRKAITSLKFKYATEIVQEICGYFVPEVNKQSEIFSSECSFVPIPIFWHRENIRGFNQSTEIGKIVAEELSLKFEPKLLIKTKSTHSQVELSVLDRKKNLKGAFAIRLPSSSFIIPNSIILFDDVFTTGSTLHEAAKVLKRNGVEKVWGMTITR